jgi:hypothetical protein
VVASPAGPVFDEAIEGCVLARRDFYLGLWAGRKLGLSGGALQDYAQSIVEADYKTPGREVLIQRLKRDFVDHCFPVERDEIESALRRSEANALEQFMVSD